MMRVAIVALFVGQATAVKVSEESPLHKLLSMLFSMQGSAEQDEGKLAKECAEEATQMDLTKTSLRENLNRLVGSEKVPGGACTGCAGEYALAEIEKDACSQTSTAEGNKATAALSAMRVAKYGEGSRTQCTGTAPPATDLSVCATRHRLDAKKDQGASVERQCKKTTEIMNIAINIYKSSGLGSSFIQLTKEENVMDSAKAFLQNAESSLSNSGRSNELSKLLHDFLQQVKRDCHQDISDIRADEHALQMHMTSKDNSAASEKRAYDTATQRKHEADTCVATQTAAMTAINSAAETDYTAHKTLCPPNNVDCSTGDSDWTCASLSTGENRAACAGSIMKKEADCKKISGDMSSYLNKLQDMIALIQTQVGFIQVGQTQQPLSFVQTDEKASGVDFQNLVSAIGKAMENEIAKLAADATDVNLFAAQCENALLILDLPETGAADLTGCTVGGGTLCSDTTPLPETCGVCLQESQCDTLGDEMIAAANSEQQKQNTQDAMKEKYDDAVAAYATHSKMDADARVEHARRLQKYTDDYAAIDAAKTQLTTWQSNSANNINVGNIGGFLTTLTELATQMQTTWNAYNTQETQRQQSWDAQAPSDSNSESYWQMKTQTDCTVSTAATDSYFCLSQTAMTQKLAFATTKAAKQNSIFNECGKTDSTLNKMKANLEARKAQCKVGVTKDLKEELHKMTEALQILQQAKTKIAGTA